MLIYTALVFDDNNAEPARRMRKRDRLVASELSGES